ncbi:alpha/beta hydrolase [Nonomuraea sp. NPDC048892]|uniref:alpha/beta hydrolase n=1 Tax=Nonomuraea sp. NPDC048892 TaxID=3154624 RepID=UPI0033CC4F5F
MGTGARAREAVLARSERADRAPGSAAIQYLSTGHSLYNSGIPCIITHVNRYLISLRLPAPGIVCRPAT